LVLHLHLRRRKSSLPYPPGPKLLPLIENLRKLPRNNDIQTYFRWAKEYGDIFHVEVLRRHMVFLNSAKATQDLFEKRSVNYSDRNHLHMINDLMGWDWSFGMIPFGERWKRHRKLFDRQLRASNVSTFWSIQEDRTRSLLVCLLNSPENLAIPSHMNRNITASTIMKIIYGIDILPQDDHYITVAEEALAMMAKAAASRAFLVDFLPVHACNIKVKKVPAWFPGAGFWRKAAEWKKITYRMRDVPFDHVMQAMGQGKVSPCFVSELLASVQAKEIAEDEVEMIKNSAGLAYTGMSSTMVSSLLCFFLAMILYPAVQHRAQQELDTVCGGRIPTFNDRSSLPYINAICLEMLRWNPGVGLPHMVTDDDEYSGYFIPVGSTVIGKAILHDEETYPEPMRFSPERFLSPDSATRLNSDPAVGAFGYGRRICPGRFIADNSLFITIASVLKVFDIEPGVDDAGNLTLTEAAFTNGIISHPESFKFSIKPRSSDAIALITQAGDP
ncbi:cytochrome P450, partial [Obba rivulosa]